MMKMAAAFGALFVVSACASGSTLVLEPPTNTDRFAAASVEAMPATVAVSSEMADYFRSSLEAMLFEEEGGFDKGDGLTVEYRFLQFDEGNRALRYTIGYGAGKGGITIEVKFKDASGQQISRINVGGEIQSGLAGGSIKQALDRAAMEAAEYARINFKG